jgi:predicted alpha/beta superfamily hydrolase
MMQIFCLPEFSGPWGNNPSWQFRFFTLTFIIFAIMTKSVPAKQDSLLVCFQVAASNLPDTAKVYITGNQPQLGNWQPDQVALQKQTGTNIWSAEFKFPSGQILEYKFTRGQWSAEAVNADGTIPPNSILKVREDTTLFTVISYWKDAFQYDLQGQITGTVYYHRRIEVNNIKPRDIIVWLPPDYDKNAKHRYPVLYMHDGQNIIDPRTSAFGIDWQIDETADSLIRNKKISPLIIVGIYNTAQRNDEYAPSDTGRAYMKFVVEKLKPLIDNTYRTLPGREHTATGGSSLGGLISFMLLWEYPQIFSKAACFSPALKVGALDYVSRVRQDGKQKMPVKIYLDNGGVGLEEKLQPGIDEMLAALKDIGYTADQDYYWYKDSTATHNESAWAKRVWRPLVLFWGRNL